MFIAANGGRCWEGTSWNTSGVSKTPTRGRDRGRVSFFLFFFFQFFFFFAIYLERDFFWSKKNLFGYNGNGRKMFLNCARDMSFLRLAHFSPGGTPVRKGRGYSSEN